MKPGFWIGVCWASLTLLGAVPCRQAASTASGDVRILWTGDILLSRLVEAALAKGADSPWREWASTLKDADWVAGNLEGAVGSVEDCREGTAPCFPIAAGRVALLGQAGFRALGVENNHAWDLGEGGRQRTLATLQDKGLMALDFETSPHFLEIKGTHIAIVALNLVGGPEHHALTIPNVEVRQKLRLARALSDLVIVSVHWGSEFLEWPNASQREGAAWLVKQGADLIIGHHPHVVQVPEAVAGHPVFWSLGNHVFDQKYPATREGLVADCRIQGGTLRCQGIASAAETGQAGSSPKGLRTFGLPDLVLHGGLSCAGYQLRALPDPSRHDGAFALVGYQNGKKCWQGPTRRFASVEVARLDGQHEFVVALEWHPSPLDHEVALRPYVYQVTPIGLEARWRGTALAWPLVDARVLKDDETILGVLHRGDSFLAPNPAGAGSRVAAYRWNGFGFSGVDDPGVTNRCRQRLEGGVFEEEAGR